MQRQRPHKNTVKTHNLSHTVLMLAPYREHSVTGKGVIFAAVFSVQIQPTWQSQSLLIGLILGDLLQDFITGIVRCYHVLCNLSLYMLP